MPVFNGDKLPVLKRLMLEKAETQSREMKLQTERLRTHRLEKAKSQALQDAYQFIQEQQGDLNIQVTAAMSQSGMRRRKRLLAQRDSRAQELFSAVRQRLIAFAGSGEEYENFLKSAVENAAVEGWFSSGRVIVRLSPRDMKYEPLIRRTAGDSCELTAEEDPGISIGGFLLEDPDRGLMLDETLEQRLASQKEWFYRNSGFTVEAQF